MEEMYMVINIDRCWGCRACQTACKWEHGLKPGDGFPIEVFRIEQVNQPDQPNQLDRPDQPQVRCHFLPVLCLHCDTPSCQAACPKHAVYRDHEGLVQIRGEDCIGCGACVNACPYGAVDLQLPTEGVKKAVKCDLCRERRKRGYPASCEQHCLGGALTTCTETQKKRITEAFPYKFQCGKTIYVSQQAADLGLKRGPFSNTAR